MSQMTQVHTAGTRILLDYLQALANGELSAPQQLANLWQEPSFRAWVDAYGPWMEAEGSLQALLKNPADIPAAQPEGFWQAIARGWQQAGRPEVYTRCLKALDALEKANFASSEKAALAYLPAETRLEVEVFATLDGFNGGMFRGKQVFISVLNIGEKEIPAVLSGKVGLGCHELHHVGASYWFERSAQLAKVKNDFAGGKLAVQVIEYVVSEGMANAFLSPEVFLPLKDSSPAALAYNERLNSIASGWPGTAVAQIEMLVSGSLAASNLEEIAPVKQAFERFSLDYSGTGLPEGHFSSGKMFQQMAQVLPLEAVIDLVQAPWRFFELFNAACAPGEPCFSDALVGQVERIFSQPG